MLNRRWITRLLLVITVAVPVQATYLRDVPFFRQGSNRLNPSGSCQNTCMAMVLNYYSAGIAPDDISARWGTGTAQTVGGWQEVFNTLAAERGLPVRSEGISDGRLSGLYRHLDAGFPVTVHGNFTASGHLVVVVGYDDDYVYVNDPAGDWSRGYTSGQLLAGKDARYPRAAFERVVEELLSGHVRYHAIRPLEQPLEVSFAWAWPDSAVVGQPLDLELTVQLERTVPGASRPQVTADLTALGGSDAVALTPIGEGGYQLRTLLPPIAGAPGRRMVPVTATQASGGQRYTAIAKHRVTLAAPEPAMIYRGGWTANWEAGFTSGMELQPEADDPMSPGKTVLQVTAQPFLFEWLPVEPLDPVGYTALRFAFHAGTVSFGERRSLALQVNNDSRTLLQLLAPQGGAAWLDATQSGWQVIEVPLKAIAWNEAPIERVRLFGNLTGIFFLDDIGFIPAAPCPLAATWENVSTDSLVAGEAYELAATVKLRRRSPAGGAVEALADFSALGGPENLAPTVRTDTTFYFHFSGRLVPEHGHRPLEIRIRQHDGQQEHVLRMRRMLTVVPAGDVRIFEDDWTAGWSLRPIAHVEARIDSRVVYAGEAALAVQARSFTLDLLAPEEVDPVGYVALRFAIHPGSAAAGARRPAFNVLVNGDGRTTVRLLDAGAATPHFDLGRSEWQLVEIPLAEFGPFDEPIRSFRVLGNLEGTFYLDEVRLVTARPALPTAVAQEAVAVQASILHPGYPNPFNSRTVLRFTLAAPAQVELVVYNALGQEVHRLIDGPHAAGLHAIAWDGRNRHGRELASGLYLCRLRAGDRFATRKILLLR